MHNMATSQDNAMLMHTVRMQCHVYRRFVPVRLSWGLLLLLTLPFWRPVPQAETSDSAKLPWTQALSHHDWCRLSAAQDLCLQEQHEPILTATMQMP